MEKVKGLQTTKMYLGIELGSTRIKAVLIDEDGNVLASGGHDWENHFENGVWTYPLEEAWEGLANCYADLVNNYGEKIETLDAIGISGMMHGHLAFDQNGNQLAEFRTWRNNITGEAADKLTELFQYNIPQRWSVSHLYQAILEDQPHVKDIAYMTTLSGYIHWKLTGKKVLGVGDASGMFPIEIATHTYNQSMIDKFKELTNFDINCVFPKVLVAGEDAGTLSEEGAKLLDKSGTLKAGIPMCPPEGDAGTGMVATNSLSPRMGNVSAGTSAFAMLVLEKELKCVHRSLDMVTTPAGDLVAMAHANNCTTEINSWMSLFKELAEMLGSDISMGDLFELTFNKSLEGDADCAKLLGYCFHSGEHGVGLTEGCPLFLHPTDATFNMSNFIRAQIYSCFGVMKLGMDILINEEDAKIDKILGHGGIFKTEGVAQRMLSAAIGAPVEVMETASEGGAWGIALLAAYLDSNESLVDFINNIFADAKVSVIDATDDEKAGYEKFMERFKVGLEAEREATKLC
ncbi:MAG: FGGY-family carbohydrate kinase [Coriobacteriia bacterium]|nr:FGGY-family carbohydrate kinase [Coriobacteriia bacterium]